MDTCSNPQDNLLESVELFNANVTQEWHGFLDTTITSTTTVGTASTRSAYFTTISSTATTTNSHVVACTNTHHDSFTSNNRGNSVQDNATTSLVSQFTGNFKIINCYVKNHWLLVS